MINLEVEKELIKFLENKISSYFPLIIIFDEFGVLKYFKKVSSLNLFEDRFEIYYIESEFEFRKLFSGLKEKIYQENNLIILKFRFFGDYSDPYYIQDILTYSKYLIYCNSDLFEEIFSIKFSPSIINPFDYNLIRNFFKKIQDYKNMYLSLMDKNGTSRYKIEDFIKENLTLDFWLNLFLDEENEIFFFNNILDIFLLFYKNQDFQTYLEHYPELRKNFELKIVKYGPKEIIKNIYFNNRYENKWISKILLLSIISKILMNYFILNGFKNTQSIVESFNSRLNIIDNIDSMRLDENDSFDIIKHFSGLFDKLIYDYKYSFLYRDYFKHILKILEDQLYESENKSFFQSFHQKVKIFNINLSGLNNEDIYNRLKYWISTNYEKRICIFFQDFVEFCLNIKNLLENISLDQYNEKIKLLILKKIRDFKDLHMVKKTFKSNFDFIEEVLNFYSLAKKIYQINLHNFTQTQNWFDFLKIYYNFEEIISVIECFINYNIEEIEYQVLIEKLKEIHLELKININGFYTDWFIKSYKSWLERLIQQDNGYFKIVDNLPPEIPFLTSTFLHPNKVKINLLGKNETYFFIIFDCLRFDFFDIVRDIFKKNYDKIFDENVFTVIPSSTDWSRRAIFRASFRSQFRFDGDERRLLCKNLKLEPQTNNKNVSYFHIKDEDSIRECISNIKKYNIIIIDWSDKIIHDIQALGTNNLKKIKAAFKKNFQEIFKPLLPIFSKFENHKLIICSDHGWIKIPNNQTITLELGDFNNFSSSPSLRINEFNNIQSRYFFSDRVLKKSDDFWYIPRNNIGQYGFPLNLRPFDQPPFNGSYNCYILKKLKVLGTKEVKRKFTHGGISIDEIIVPFIIYSFKEQDLKFDKNKFEFRIISKTSILLDFKNPYIKIILVFINNNLYDVELENIKVTNPKNKELVYSFEERIAITSEIEMEKSFIVYQEVKENGNIIDLPLDISAEIKYKDEFDNEKIESITKNLKELKIFDFAKPVIQFKDTIGEYNFMYGFKDYQQYYVKKSMERPLKQDKIEIPFDLINLNQKRIVIKDLQVKCKEIDDIEIIYGSPEDNLNDFSLNERGKSDDIKKNLILILKPKCSGEFTINFEFNLSMYPIQNRKIQLNKRIFIYSIADFKQRIKEWI